MDSTPMASLRAKQREQIFKMLNLNEEVVTASRKARKAASGLGADEWSESWKVLVYDRFCAAIISPLLSVKALRVKGVTLHLLIDTERDRIADVPAVYFVQPNADNVARIAKDCAGGLYDEFHLNFVSHLPRQLLETLARGVVQTDSVRRISKVYQQCLNFVALEHHLFSLNLQHSFRVLHDSTVPDSKIEATMLNIAQGLLAVCMTLGCVPIIRFKSGRAGEMIGRHLNALLKEQLSSKNALQASALRSGLFQRPLLLLVERSTDLGVAVGHTSTYQALVDDMLGIKSNRVKVDVEKDGRVTQKRYDLDSDSDAFWQSHRGSPFPEAIAANGDELAEVSKKEEEVRKKTGETSADTEAEVALIASGMGGALADAVDSLPVLLNRKRMLEQHTNVLRGVMQQVAARHVPTYHELEKNIASGTSDKAAVFELLGDGERGHMKDKLRLAQVYLLHVPSESVETEAAALQTVLRQFGEVEGATDDVRAEAALAVASIKWLGQYLRSERAIAVLETPAARSAPSGPASGAAGDRWASGLNFFSGVAEKAAGHAVGFINKAVANVKSFLPSHDQLRTTRLAAAEMNGRTHAESASYVTLDPKLSSTSASAGAAGGGAAGAGAGAGAGSAGAGAGAIGSRGYKRAIVFMIGGGCYSEYHNLQDFARKPGSNKDIIYGCTELLSPDGFQEQLAALARSCT